MQIVIICDPGHVDGGAAKVAIASARGLAAAGTPVTYICATGPVAPELRHPGITVHCLEIESVWRQSNRLAAGVQGIWNGRAAEAVEEILSRLPRQDTVGPFSPMDQILQPQRAGGAGAAGAAGPGFAA